MAPVSKASQEFVPIKEIRDGVVILEDGSMRSVVMTSSVNLALKSGDEQMSVLMQFQNFLNSLDFPVEISIQSRKYDIRPYLSRLEELEQKQSIELLKVQTHEYIEFIKRFTANSNIMKKNFFVVIPYYPQLFSSGKGGLSGLFFPKGKNKTSDSDAFEENKNQLKQRTYVVEQGLVRGGRRSVELGTDELVELFYKLFNPGEQDKPMQISQ